MISESTVKSPAEIAELKRQWLRDDCWDIEDTPGFEPHREELITFREQMKREAAERAAEYRQRVPEVYQCDTMEPERVAEYLNRKCAAGWLLHSLTPCTKVSEEGTSWPTILVLLKRKDR